MWRGQVLELAAVVMRGRNLKNMSVVQEMLPYPLIEHLVINPTLRAMHLDLVIEFVTIATDAYINHEPHEIMTQVRPALLPPSARAHGTSHPTPLAPRSPCTPPPSHTPPSLSLPLPTPLSPSPTSFTSCSFLIMLQPAPPCSSFRYPPAPLDGA